MCLWERRASPCLSLPSCTTASLAPWSLSILQSITSTMVSWHPEQHHLYHGPSTSCRASLIPSSLTILHSITCTMVSWHPEQHHLFHNPSPYCTASLGPWSFTILHSITNTMVHHHPAQHHLHHGSSASANASISMVPCASGWETSDGQAHLRSSLVENAVSQ